MYQTQNIYLIIAFCIISFIGFYFNNMGNHINKQAVFAVLWSLYVNYLCYDWLTFFYVKWVKNCPWQVALEISLGLYSHYEAKQPEASTMKRWRSNRQALSVTLLSYIYTHSTLFFYCCTDLGCESLVFFQLDSKAFLQMIRFDSAHNLMNCD